MTITAEVTQECGCNVEEVWVDSFKVAGYNILYCPRHAAADAMYEAIEEVLNDGWNHSYEDTWVITQDTRERLKAALALADGDGGDDENS